MRIARAIAALLPLLLSACLSQPSAPSTAPPMGTEHRARQF